MRVYAFARIIVLFFFLGLVLFASLNSQLDLNHLVETPTTPTETLIEDTSLTQQSADCTFPCWNGFRPGATTLDEVHQALPNIPFFSRASLSDEDSHDNRTRILWVNPDVKGQNRIFFENNILEAIHINPNTHFTLEDILSRYGVPPAFSIHYDRGVEIVHALVQLNLYYPQQGLVFELTIFSGNPSYPEEHYVLRGSSILQSFMVFEPADTIDEFLELNWRHLRVSASTVLTDWPGVGSIIDAPCNGNLFSISHIAAVEPTNTPIAAMRTPLTVTVDQAANQQDPTSERFLVFTVIFSRPVTCFERTDIRIEGKIDESNLGAVMVGGSGAEYTVYISISAVQPSGRVVVSIPAGVVEDYRGISNLASTSIDNVVTISN